MRHDLYRLSRACLQFQHPHAPSLTMQAADETQLDLSAARNDGTNHAIVRTHRGAISQKQKEAENRSSRMVANFWALIAILELAMFWFELSTSRRIHDPIHSSSRWRQEGDIMETSLYPKPRRLLRMVLFILLVAFFSINHATWISKLAFAAWMALFFGSYRVARLNDGWFERQMVFMFVPLKRKRWQLARFIEIETSFEESLHI